MARRDPIRVRPGPPIDAALRATAREGDDSPTLRLNSIAERYLAMVEDVRPALHRNEWLAICDANNGYGLVEEIQAADGSGSGLSWQMIWADVADSPELGEKWSVDQDALVRKLRDMSTAQKISVAETIQRFWAHYQMPTSQALDMATSHPATWPNTESD